MTLYLTIERLPPLLKLVGHPNTVNPDPTLLAYAKEMGWPVNAWR